MQYQFPKTNRPLTAHLKSCAICCNCQRISCVIWIKFASDSSDRNRYEKESITISRIWKVEKGNWWSLLIRKWVRIKIKQWIAAYRRCFCEQILQSVDSRQKFDVFIAKWTMNVAHHCIDRKCICPFDVIFSVRFVTLFFNAGSNFWF